jgi:hypothetical protein
MWLRSGDGEAPDGPISRARRLTLDSKRAQSADDGETLGWLRTAGAPGYFPLFSTTHPVTGDQLVTALPEAALARGYLADGTLGWIYVPSERPSDLD